MGNVSVDIKWMGGKHKGAKKSALRVITLGVVFIFNEERDKSCFICTVNVFITFHSKLQA